MSLKLVVLLALLGIATAYPSHGPARASLSTFRGGARTGLGIYKGKNTTIENHPYLAVLSVPKESFFCAGVILSKSWILTLGDCIYQIPKSEMSVLVGSSDALTGKKYKVKNVVSHPKFQANYFLYDYALVEIKGSFTWGSKVSNISLPSKRLPDNTKTVMSGYGDTSGENGLLLEGNVKILANATCAKVFKQAFGYWDESELCASSNGKATMCENDFGDPLVHNGVVYGLALGGLADNFCTSKAYPFIVSDIFLVVDWIQKTIGAKISGDFNN